MKTWALGIAALAWFVGCSRDSKPRPQVGEPAPQGPVFVSKDGRTLPAMAELAKLLGDAVAGAKVFRDPKAGNCIACHQVGDEGRFVGPPLTVIGQKLTKEQLVESIFFPSAAILMGYETWVVRTKSGDVKTGLLTEENDDHLTLKDSNGEYIDIPTGDVSAKKKSDISMMPEGLVSAMTFQEFVNLIEYLSGLR